MKTFFIHAKSNADIKPVLKKIKFNGVLGVLTTIQFLEQATFFIKSLTKNEKERFVFGGQVLGCNVNNALRIKDKVDGYLFIGSGDFHPLGALYKLGKPVYVANPNTNDVKLLDTSEFHRYEKRKKAMISKFLMAKRVGILISIKPGQFHPRTYDGLKEKITYANKIKDKIKDKETFIFVGDNFDLNELENFRDVDVWINTACPRIEGKDLLNAEEVFRLYEK